MGIETLDGTSVVASFTHGKHESLCHESTTFVEHSVHGPFCHLARNGSKPTSKGAYDLAHPSPQSEEATIKERNDFGVIGSLEGSIFLPLRLRISALDIFALEINVLLATLFVERGFYGENHQLLSGAYSSLS